MIKKYEPIGINGKNRIWEENDYGKTGYYHHIRTLKGYYVLNKGRLSFIKSRDKIEPYELFQHPLVELLYPALEHYEIKEAIQENEDVIEYI